MTRMPLFQSWVTEEVIKEDRILGQIKKILCIWLKKWYDGEVIELVFFLIKICLYTLQPLIKYFSSFTVFLLKSKDLQRKKSYLETLYEFHSKCNPDTKSIQTLVVPKAANSLEVIDRACSSEHCNVWKESVHLHCWLLKIPPRLYLLFFSHCLERRKKKKSLGLCLCITRVLICADCIW